MRCFSLFSGAGGLDLGLEAAGFSVSASVEVDAECCETLKRNVNWHVVNCSVADIDAASLAAPGTVALVAGGPPCQPFSKSALWTSKGARGLADKRAETLHQFFDVVARLKPQAFLLENVEGFATGGGLEFLQIAVSQLRMQGLAYGVSWRVLNAADYGVPQKRKRFMAVGLLGDQEFIFPEPTHGPERLPPLSVWDAFAPLGDKDPGEDLSVRGRWANLLPSIPAGSNYLWHTTRGGGLPLFGWRTRYWSFLNKLHPLQPSPTIVASPSQNSGPFHWEDRLLSTSEMAAIQTFPVDYRFSGNRASRQRQIGNAVPPLLAEVVGRQLVKALGKKPPSQMSFLPARTAVASPVVSLKPVGPQYLRLKGDHQAHPGAGKGPKPRTGPKLQEATAQSPHQAIL